MIARYRRFSSLSPSRRRLLLEAASLISFAWIGLRVLRFPTLRRALSRHVGSAARATVGQSHAAAIDQVRWAITTAGSLFPFATCLVQALAADAMFRRRGLACELRVGVRVRRNSAVPFDAHAWVHCDGAVVIGAIENLTDFTLLCTLRSP